MDNNFGGYFFSGLSIGFLSLVETAQLTEQLGYLLTIISAGLSILWTVVKIIMKVISWFKKAFKDKKITKDEIADLHKDVAEDLNEFVDQVEDLNKHKKKEV